MRPTEVKRLIYVERMRYNNGKAQRTVNQQRNIYALHKREFNIQKMQKQADTVEENNFSFSCIDRSEKLIDSQQLNSKIIFLYFNLVLKTCDFFRLSVPFCIFCIGYFRARKSIYSLVVFFFTVFKFLFLNHSVFTQTRSVSPRRHS